MLHRDQRTPFSDWWWTVDKLLLGAIMALMLGGVILSLAASPPVATRIGLDPFHFFGRHSFCCLLMVLIGVPCRRRPGRAFGHELRLEPTGLRIERRLVEIDDAVEQCPTCG